MQVAAIIALIQGIIAAVPTAVKLAQDTKVWVTSLFEAGVITAEDQNTIHAYVDDLAAAVLAGTPPPEFVVRPDPS